MDDISLPEAHIWMTLESEYRLSHGGNNKGAVPVHGKRSSTAVRPLYTAEELEAAILADRKRRTSAKAVTAGAKKEA